MSNNNNSPERKFYFLKDLVALTGLSAISLRRMWEAGKFPRPIKLNGGKLVWSVAVIHAWFAANGC